MSSSGEFLVFVATIPVLWQVPRAFWPVRVNSAGTGFTGLYRRYSVESHTGYVSDIRTKTDTLRTGTVSATSSGMVTGGMYSGHTTVTDNRVTHEREHTKFFLTDDTGKAWPVDAVNVEPSIGEGHLVSAAWLVRKGRTGNAFLVYNHTTGRINLEPVRLGWLSAPRGLSKMVLPLPAIYMILLVLMIVTIPLLMLFVFAAKWQVRRFLNHGGQPLLSAMKRRAAAMPARLSQAPPAVPVQERPGDVLDLATQVKEISVLHDSGVLTDDEFQAAKTKLLGRA